MVSPVSISFLVVDLKDSLGHHFGHRYTYTSPTMCIYFILIVLSLFLCLTCVLCIQLEHAAVIEFEDIAQDLGKVNWDVHGGVP